MFSKVPVNLECSINREIIERVTRNKPHRATLVPEKRQEVTTEGGLDVVGLHKEVGYAIEQLHKNGIGVSLFVDPTIEAIEYTKKLGADMVELHTGHFANLFAMLHSSLPHSNHSIPELQLPRDVLTSELEKALLSIDIAAKHARKIGLEVAAGHGLNYQNVYEMVQIDAITELNIGQSIVARSVFTGLKNAVSEMKKITIR